MQIYGFENRDKYGSMHKYTFYGMGRKIVTIKSIIVFNNYLRGVYSVERECYIITKEYIY